LHSIDARGCPAVSRRDDEVHRAAEPPRELDRVTGTAGRPASQAGVSQDHREIHALALECRQRIAQGRPARPDPDPGEAGRAELRRRRRGQVADQPDPEPA
jgi:hypothetical protein